MKKRKARRVVVVTTRSTAGPGFDFEDRVAAWFLLRMLLGEPLPAVDGVGGSLQMQTAALRWFIEDLLVVSALPTRKHRQLAISCKSNVQVSEAGVPASFVEAAWRQWWNVSIGPMQVDDRLMLVTRGRHPGFLALWSDVKDWSSGDDTLALGRILATEKHRKIFNSVKDPAAKLGHPVSDVETLELVRRIEILPLDIHLGASQDEQNAIGQCRSLLRNGTLAEGRALWTILVDRARDARIGDGSIVLTALWRELRAQFALRDHPDFRSSWDRVRALTADYRSTIEVVLPSGYKAERKRTRDELKTVFHAGAACALYGESGTGKSALLKDIIDAVFPDASQVWLGPGTLAAALSESERGTLGLDYPLFEILDGAASPNNFLIIDAAERLPKDVLAKAKGLVQSLLAGNKKDAEPGWRVIAVGQTEAWADGRLQELLGNEQLLNVELTDLSNEEVRAALRSSSHLRWLTTHNEAISVLGNPRTLAWVMEAEGRFQSQGSPAFSLPIIADRVWSFWTHDKASTQRLMMRLGEREASFEHSFPLSELDGDEVQAFETRTNQCPLRLNSRNRIQFQHDLASEWARFQRLKEIADDTARWAVLASNPSWNGALRMLGQLLLRDRQDTVSAWDAAFTKAEQIKDKAPLAGDILLDALFLDPNAEEFLAERAEMLFANDAALLQRLLIRFEHVASVPGISSAANVNSLTRLYFEAKFRTPILGRWPAIARFLTKHRERIAELMLPVVCRLSERWLSSLPLTTGDGERFPFRNEFAWFALDAARSLQLAQAKRIIFLGDFEEPIYNAALAAAHDLPDEVAEWALEVAQRGNLRGDIAAKVKAHRKEESEKHRQRLTSDPEYRERYEQRRRGASVSIPDSGRRLPPWPLGPRHRVEHDFRKLCLHSPALYALMRARPAAASEVLLACIIEDSPEERYRHHYSLDHELGLEYDHEGYPTGYWKSQFFGFLRINPEVALDTLIQLLNFCTERWETEARRECRRDPPRTTIALLGGTIHEFIGDFLLFKISQADSLHTGQLNSALAALEQWLRTLLDAEVDIERYIEKLLGNSNSVAMLGVLINIGKSKPELFKGSLRPLTCVHHLYVWDDARVDQSPARWFDAFSWSREGEALFNAAREWASAPYRQVSLRQVISELVGKDALFGANLVQVTSQWTPPSEGKEALEFRILVAQLDHRNYRSLAPTAGQEEKIEFQPPADVVRDAQRFQAESQSAVLTLRLPEACRQVLSKAGVLADAGATEVAAAMRSVASDDKPDLPEDMKERARVAAAATLLARASPKWLADNREFEAEARTNVRKVISAIGDTLKSIQTRHLSGRDELQFVAHVVARDWITRSTSENDMAVLRIITSGDWNAMQVLVNLVYLARDQIGSRWWRLLFLALLWSGLSILVPRFGDEEVVGLRWSNWLRWLRKRSLSVAATADVIEPLSIAKRVERIERDRLSRNRDFEIEPGQWVSAGLEPYYVKSAFAWLLGARTPFGSDSPEFRETKKSILGLWAYERWRLIGHSKEDGDYDLLSQQLGYDIVAALAHMALNGPVGTSFDFWGPVLSLGPKGHHAIGHFITEWFSKITDQTNVDDFASRWRQMVEYVSRAPNWREGRQWHDAERLEREILGFGAETYIARSPHCAALVGGMRDLYKIWAEARLSGDEDNLAGFCRFVGSRVGLPLRLDGLLWISEAVRTSPRAARWYRDGSLDALISFLNLILSEDAKDISKDESQRQALFDLAAYVVSRNHSSGLALQERIRRMV